MTNDLNDLFQRRADRAQPPANPADVLETVRVGAQRRERAKRNRLAVGSGALIVVAASALTVVLTQGGGGSSTTPAGKAAGTVGSGSSETASASASSGAAKSAAQRRAETKKRELLAAQRAAERARYEREKTTLVPVDPAPAKAEISISLVPKGSSYLGFMGPITGYGPHPSTKNGLGDSTDKLVLDVHERLKPDGSHPLTINGRPASYSFSQGYTSVRIVYSKRIDVGFQAPPSIYLTRAQALRIASTIDVRSTKQTTKG